MFKGNITDDDGRRKIDDTLTTKLESNENDLGSEYGV